MQHDTTGAVQEGDYRHGAEESHPEQNKDFSLQWILPPRGQPSYCTCVERWKKIQAGLQAGR